MKLNAGDKVNVVNIVLMLFSCALAFLIPFELFLFVYAVLGPLHYLTEISWLHDRGYYTKGKYDYIFMVVIGVLLTGTLFFVELNDIGDTLIFLAFFSAIIFITVKNNWLKIFGMLLILILATKFSNNFFLFFSVFLPTLVHVFIFTGCFILFGALKSRSKSGILSLLVFILCPILLFVLFKDVSFVDVTSYGKAAYKKFEGLNYYTFKAFYSEQFKAFASQDDFTNTTYYSSIGITFMRFVAFAYTYHYLNWFSKTSIIKWHEVPKWRLIFVIVIWVISVGLYAYDYNLGFMWLFFLSFLHVLLEFPLNHLSFIGIFNETKSIIKARSFTLPPTATKPVGGKKK